MAALTEAEALHSAFWTPCQTRDQLRDWVLLFLGVDLADGLICDDDVTEAPSNSSPLEVAWEIYSAAMRGDHGFQRVLVYSSRDSGKTLVTSVLELLCLFHLGRDVVHLAATQEQSNVCSGYIAAYLQRAIMREYVAEKNTRKITVEWYQTRDAKYRMTAASYDALKRRDPKESERWVRKTQKMLIAVSTLSGVNAAHGSFFAIDECDLIPPNVYKEANVGITTETRDGKPPITMIVSTRKFSFGMVQAEIDNAANTKIHIRHWNLIDVAKPCPPERHLPDEPRLKIYTSDLYLKAIPEEDYAALDENERLKYEERQGYAGCLKNCRLFSVCKGRLATKQKSRSRMLKGLSHVTEKFTSSDPDFAKAQLLCWKPGTVGLVYPFLSKQRHLITAAQAAEIITGDAHGADFGIGGLIKLFDDVGVLYAAGMDFGFTHNFAVPLGALWGNTLFVFRAPQMAGLETTQKIDLCDRTIKQFNPVIYPDSESPSDIKSFRRAGYRMVKFKKDVKLGIDAVRAKIMPALGAPPEIYFIQDDAGVVFLFNQLVKHHFMIDAAGNPTEDLADDDDDGPDGVRYLCQNLFGRKIHKRGRRVNLPATQTPKPVEEMTTQEAVKRHNENLWTQQLHQATTPTSGGTQYKKGRFFFSG